VEAVGREREPRYRVAVRWAGELRYIAAGGPDGEDWRLAGPAEPEPRSRPRAEAARVMWSFRRARSRRPDFGGADLEPAPEPADEENRPKPAGRRGLGTRPRATG
jgi:hypothetical protein